MNIKMAQTTLEPLQHIFYVFYIVFIML